MEATLEKLPKRLDAAQPQKVSYCIPLWLRDEQVRVNTREVKGRIAPRYGLRDEPIAIVGYGPSLNDTWEQVKKFKHVMTCSGAHQFLLGRGIVPTWHTEVDPRPHKIQLVGPPHPDVEYLIASCCHPDYFKHLEGFNVKLWHVFDASDEPMRVLPPGEWSLTGGCDVGLRAMVLARFLGFTEQHIFGRDGCEGHSGKHASVHPMQAPGHSVVEYEGITYRTTPAFLEAARSTAHELDEMPDVKATFYGEGLVQAMMKNYKRQPSALTGHIAFNKPELISPAMVELNARLHRDSLEYGVGGGKHAETILKLAENIKTKSILDYGCGKGYLAKALPFPIWEYDPAISEKAGSPRPAELVVCTDVLEHVELDKLAFVLDDLRRCVRQVGYFVINTGAAKKKYADGRNTHLIQQDERWWVKHLGKFFTVAKVIVKGPELHIVVGPRVAQAEATFAEPPILEATRNGATVKFFATSSTVKFRVESLFTKEPVTIEWLERMKPGEVLVDVGANIGGYSLWAARRGVRVFAFEPAAKNYDSLCANIRLNRLEDKVVAYCAALSSALGLGMLRLSSQEVGAACHQLQQNGDQGCVTLTLDELVQHGHLPTPDHVKIDVDGVEPEIIEGARDTLARVKSVLVEVNEKSERHQLMVKILEHLGLGFQPHQVDQARRREGSFANYAEYLFTRERDEVDTVVNRVLEAELVGEPFPHLYVENIFPLEFYRQLVENLTVRWKPIGEARPVKGYAARSVHEPKSPFWAELDRRLRDGRLRSAVGAKLSCYDPRWQDETLLIRDEPGYQIGPHTDAPAKVATLLFYLPSDERLAGVGTSLYTPKREGFRCAGGPHYPFEEFARAKTMPFRPNSLFAFAKTDRSFHGVEPWEVGARHTLLYDVRRP